MSGTQVLDIRVVNCGGLADLMSEMEASFLVSALGLFRNREDLGRGYPRANVNLFRAYRADDFYRAAFSDAHLLHIIGHGDQNQLQVGIARKRVEAAGLAKESKRAGQSLPEVVISTGCKLQSQSWRAGLKAAGAKALIASKQNVTPACLTAFDMSFYSALLAQVRRGTPLLDRVEASFKIADSHYRSIHAVGTPFAKFSLELL